MNNIENANPNDGMELFEHPFYHDNNPKSITPSGYFGSSKDNIVEVEDFLTPSEITYLYNFMKTNTHWDHTESQWDDDGTMIYDASYWEDRVATWHTLEKTSPEAIMVIANAILRMKPVVEKFFNVKAFPTKPALVRWTPGTFQNPHADKELHIGDDAGKPNLFPHYDLAGLFYLNDEYEGGELFFPNQDLKFKPKKGGAYFFPGDMNYIHGITEITSGERYTVPFFWTITELGELDAKHN
jgi:predicted 2-oxoglutarate/Fe(II)-dependent dioxygenase YbiX